MYPGGAGNTTFYVINSDGTDEHLIDSGALVSAASWSPDGRRLAWVHADAIADGVAQIDVADADGRNVKAFPHVGIPRHGLDTDVASICTGWTVDGKQVVAILTSDGAVIDRLLQIDPDTGATVIFDTPGLRAWNQQRLAP